MKPRMIAQRLRLSKDQVDEVKRAGQAAGPRGRAGLRGQPPGPRPAAAAAGRRRRPVRRPSGASKSRVLGVFHRSQKASDSSARRPLRQPRTHRIHTRQEARGEAARHRRARAPPRPGHLHPEKIHRRRRQRRPRAGATATRRRRKPVFARSGAPGMSPSARGEDRRSGRSADAAVRRPLPRIRPGRATSRSMGRCSRSRFASAIRAPRRAAGRQGGLRDGPLPLARPRRRRRDRRGARAAGQAGRRYALDPPRVQPARRFRRRRRWKRPGAEAEKFDESIPPGRLDLTGLTIVTIDPVDARDFDDAISLERLDGGTGGWACTSPTSRTSSGRGTALDREARARGHQRLSARPRDPHAPGDHFQRPGQPPAGQGPLHQDGVHGVHRRGAARRTRSSTPPPSAAASGSPTSRSTRSSPTATPGGESWGRRSTPLLGDMHALAMILRKRRMSNGCLELSLPEVKVDLDDSGRVAGARVVENTESHQIIEEFMLAANEAVARMLFANGASLPPPHPPVAQRGEDLRPGGLHSRTGLSRREPAKPLRVAEAPGRRRRAGRSSGRSTSPCCGRCNGPSTAPMKTATTPWPAIAIATSPPRSAAIPT